MTSLRDLTSDILHAPPQRDHATNVPVYELTEQGLREFAARVLEDAIPSVTEQDESEDWFNDGRRWAGSMLEYLAKKWREEVGGRA